MKLFLSVVLVSVSAILAANFAASGEIKGDIGGIRNIAGWQKTHKRMAIFDAGNFSAMSETANTEVCSLMQTVNYSAIAMGLAELKYSVEYWENMNKKFVLPLLATNIKTDKKIFEKIRTVQYDKSGEKYAVVAIIGNENACEFSSDYELEDPRTSLAAAIKQIPNDYMIILIAQCEPKLADSLINEYPQIAFGIQGYKRIGENPASSVGYKKVLQPGGGEKISVLDKKGRVKWKVFSQKTQPQTTTATSQISKPVITVEIFAMSNCPYSKDAIKDFLPLMSDSSYSIRISFAGNFDSVSHKLSPGLPGGSMEEEKIWLAVQDLFPEKFRDFLFLAIPTENYDDIIKIATNLGLTQTIYDKWNKEKGDKILADNYKKSQTLNITECPTIIADNQITDLPSPSVIRNLCRLTGDKYCFGFNAPVRIKVVLSDYETPNLPVELVLESSFGESPLLIDTLNLEDTQTKEILEELAIERLPVIISENGSAWNWGEIPDGVYYKRDFHENETVIIADSAITDEIRNFIKENLPNFKNWYLLTDSETDGWLIWRDNRNLISGNDITDAKTLLKYYEGL